MSRRDGSTCLGMVTHGKPPGITIYTIRVQSTLWNLFVRLQDVGNDTEDAMGVDADPPSQIADCVVNAYLSRVALTLESVTRQSTRGRSCVARSHEDRICGMSKVIDPCVRSVLVLTNVVAWWGGQTEATSSEGIRKSFKGDGRKAICQAQQGCNDTSE